MRRRHFFAAAEVLSRALPARARERIFSLDLVQKRWTAVVGELLARRSEPESLQNGVLTIRVTDAAWGRMILRLEGRILPALNRALGLDLVRRINFTTRSRLMQPRPEPPMADERRETAPPASVVQAAEKIADPELRALVTGSAARYLGARAANKNPSRS